MLRLKHRLGLVLTMLAGALMLPVALQAQTTTAPQSHPKTVHHHKKPAPAEETPQPAPPPPTLEQQQPQPPDVTYNNGQLTIDARNATLSQVLHSVQAKTGASIDVPASASNDRVATVIGPGQPRDVLVSLLNGTKFDYVILGINGNPGGIQRVILTPRQAGGSQTTSGAVQQQQQPQAQDQSEEDQAAEVEAEPPPPEHPMAPGRFRPPIFRSPNGEAAPEQPQMPQPSQDDNANQDMNGKTPEQMLEELQKIQEQQQLYQQQLNPANQQPQK
jgi:hypothetical protein